jgi:uncharacterized protein (UPF0218 family)
MSRAYYTTAEIRSKMKEPFGMLIQGSSSETMKKLGAIVREEKPSSIITVGDAVSKNLHAHGIIPELSITDNVQMRKKIQPQLFPDKGIVKVKNPPGRITEEAIATIQDALKSQKHIHILVEGEEDLLALIAVLYAPENAFIIYGQPHQGIVVVKATTQKRKEAKELFKLMKKA